MRTDYAALAGRIRQALLDLDQVVARAGRLYHQSQQTGDDGYLDGVALNLHGFYVGVERIFEDIARTVERSLPAGPDWHRDLLLQMANEMTALRPAVITPAARFCLEEHRGFCRVVRDVYTFNLRPTRVQELTEGLPRCFAAIRASLVEFALLLDQLAAT